MDVQRAGRVAGDLTARRDPRFEAEAKYLALVEQIPGVVYLDPVNEASDSIFVSPQVRALLPEMLFGKRADQAILDEIVGGDCIAV